jgi:NAD(P)H-dependent FMN reductase
MTQPGCRPPLQVAVIIGSTREGRIGDRIGRWFADQASERTDIEVTVLDLAAYEFPARYPAEATADMAAFAAAVDRADAFVVVTPEYNHSFPASLKQAIDSVYDEWQAKPVGVVTYGCRSYGVHALDQLRTVFAALHAVTRRDGLALDVLDCDGVQRLNDGKHEPAITALLDQLCWWGHALRDARSASPYVS